MRQVCRLGAWHPWKPCSVIPSPHSTMGSADTSERLRTCSLVLLICCAVSYIRHCVVHCRVGRVSLLPPRPTGWHRVGPYSVPVTGCCQPSPNYFFLPTDWAYRRTAWKEGCLSSVLCSHPVWLAKSRTFCPSTPFMPDRCLHVILCTTCI